MGQGWMLHASTSVLPFLRLNPSIDVVRMTFLRDHDLTGGNQA